jgi:hypothetical protein
MRTRSGPAAGAKAGTLEGCAVGIDTGSAVKVAAAFLVVGVLILLGAGGMLWMSVGLFGAAAGITNAGASIGVSGSSVGTVVGIAAIASATVVTLGIASVAVMCLFFNTICRVSGGIRYSIPVDSS